MIVKVPVTWQVCGFVKIKAKSISDAIENVEKNLDSFLNIKKIKNHKKESL